MNHYIYLNHNLRVITDEKIETSGKVSIFLVRLAAHVSKG